MWFWILWTSGLLVWLIWILPSHEKEEKKKIQEAMKNVLEEERLKNPPPPRTPHPNYDWRNMSSEELLDIIEKRRDAEERARWR